MANAYGIDLGATYSRIATLNLDGMPVIISNDAEGRDDVASAIFYLNDGRCIVGEFAIEAGIEEPERLCQYFKNHLGCDESELENGEESNRYIVDGISKDPVELTAIVLTKIVEYAREAGENVKNIVATCRLILMQSSDVRL